MNNYLNYTTFPKMFILIRISLVFLLIVGTASAQSSDQSNAPGASGDLTLLELVKETGFLVWPLAALSIAAVFLIIFYTLTVRRGAVVSNRFMRSADSLIRNQDYLGLLSVCNRQAQ